MKRNILTLFLMLALVLLTGCGRSAESALQSSDMETYSFSIDRERVDSIRLIQDRETQTVWTTDDPEQIDTICDLFSGLNYGPRRYDAGYAGTYLRIEFMPGDALIRQIALANPDEVQFLDEEPGFCVSILSGAWSEAEWESFLAAIPASPPGAAPSDEALSGDSTDAVQAIADTFHTEDDFLDASLDRIIFDAKQSDRIAAQYAAKLGMDPTNVLVLSSGWDVYGTGNPSHYGYIEDWLWYVGKIDGTWTVLDFGENDSGRPYAASTDFVP